MNQVCTPPASSSRETPSYASMEDAHAALRLLSDLDTKKLHLIARFHCQAYALPAGCMEPLELLHEAVVCTLDGRKQWRHGVSLVYHLDRAMENIAWRARRKLRRRVEAVAGHLEEEDANDPLDQMRADVRRHYQDADTKAAAQEQADAAFLLFNDDPPSRMVLQYRAEGRDKKEIQALLQLSDTAYATISKRILRKLTPYYDKPRSAGR